MEEARVETEVEAKRKALALEIAAAGLRIGQGRVVRKTADAYGLEWCVQSVTCNEKREPVLQEERFETEDDAYQALKVWLDQMSKFLEPEAPPRRTRAGRRPLDEAQIRDQRIVMTLTRQEFARLESVARSSGYSLSTLVHKLTFAALDDLAAKQLDGVLRDQR